MLPLAEAIIGARQAAADAGGLATVGRLLVTPNGTNAVPSQVLAWLDARAPSETGLDEIVEAVARTAAAAAERHGVGFSTREESRSPAVRFDEDLRRRLDASLGGVPAIPTGAGHVAGVLAAEVPTAMLFVRNPTGVSHSPAEHAELADCVAGVHALAAVLADLSGDAGGAGGAR
jgi:N-carbamoyl-L-amino-acid hydrolase